MKAMFGGKKVDPKEQVKQWRLTIKREMRKMDQQALKIDREGVKVKAEIKKAAKDGQLEGAKILAKELVHSRKAKERLLISKANLNSMEMQLSNQLATMRVAGAMEKSSEMMKTMNTLIKDKECYAVMRDLAHEMQQANIIDEVMEEAFEDMEPDGLEDESNEAIDKILTEIVGQELSGLADAPKQPAKPLAGRVQAQTAEEEEAGAADGGGSEEDEDLEAMQARIAALRAA